jgi:hypothetical protein
MTKKFKVSEVNLDKKYLIDWVHKYHIYNYGLQPSSKCNAYKSKYLFDMHFEEKHQCKNWRKNDIT